MKLMTTLFILSMVSATAMAQSIKTLTLDSPSELVSIKLMVKAGSAHDPVGREGLATLTARLVLEGSYGDAKSPVTKEMLADMVRPWGSGALPSVMVEKETATFSFLVPKGAMREYVQKVLQPMFARPLFAKPELDRIRKDLETYIKSSIRYENIELF